MGGSLNILLSNGCCCIKCQFCISICLRLGTDERYCVTKGKIRVFAFCSCCRAFFLSSNIISARVFETRVSGYPLCMRFVLNLLIAVLNAAWEELVRRSLSASPLMKPFLTPGGWQLEKCVY